ncbi:hypothetical protein AAA799E16_00509 [Marine Group I thaumarchaeote SCGC AAA799-E16]|uniref:Uncharacterized protein n=1 Tax=Marine Group I thaumarchaeote SCGC AAA799-E16 TaxID=1502292 RepID=A0A081S784_9ARCH|nr:hypothetical protein AAA799E16_00509 [Marine Group I thaumarchaeote SCGC AAA799-E16]
MEFKILFLLLLIPGSFGVAYGHTIDAVEEYRVEIGWMNEPVVSGETNAIEFYVSPLTPCPEILEPMKCAESQEFHNGIEGLKKTVKMQLVYKDESISLPLSPDHDIPGKYYAFVNPTVSGFYQANILGSINETPISLSMHPPKVAERSYIEFPEPSDITVQQMIDGHTALIEDIGELKDSVNNLEETEQQMDIGYIGIGMGIVGIAIAVVALAKSKKN